MIVTCPNCEAKYRVNAEALSARGGKVKCANCAHVWVVEEEALTLNEPVVPAPKPTPEPVPAPEPAPTISEKPAAAIRARAQAEERKKRRAVEGAGWAGVAACVGVALLSAAVFRVNIVETWPRAAGAYAAVGMHVNPYGLEVNALNASFDHGQLVVEGVLDNITRGTRPVLPLMAQVLDAEGHVLHQWPVSLESHELTGQGAERFRTILAEVPEGAVRVEVVIAEANDGALALTEASSPASEAGHGAAHDAHGSAEPLASASHAVEAGHDNHSAHSTDTHHADHADDHGPEHHGDTHATDDHH